MAPRRHFLQPLLGPEAEGLALNVDGRGAPLATTIEGAFDSATRNRGLLGRHALAPEAALIIAPSNGIHTFGMKFPIDVIFVDRDGRVVKVSPSVPARRIRFAFRAFAVVEMAAGAIERSGLSAGDRLYLSSGAK